jgi:thioredoxin reductase
MHPRINGIRRLLIKIISIEEEEGVMSLIRSLMGRRQFLVAAGAASTVALARKKLAGLVPGQQAGIAMASEAAVPPVLDGVNNRYGNLLSPIKIRNVIVKNRMFNRAGSPPHNLQGPELYPAEVLREYYSNMAKGAAIITPRFSGNSGNRKDMRGDSAHMAIFDTEDPGVMNYIDQIIEGIHAMGSLVEGGGRGGPGGGGGQSGKSALQAAVDQAKQVEDAGYDVMGVQGARNVSDEKSVEEAIEQMEAIKRSTNLILTMSVQLDPGLRPETNDGGSQNLTSLEDGIAIAKAFDGHADILKITVGAGMASHPTNWNMAEDEPMTLALCRAFKKAGVKMLLAPNGGYHNPDLNEKWMTEGIIDMVVMSRAWNVDGDYGRKLYDGRGDDIKPCLLCNKCHGLSMNGPWITVCSVNPKLGLEPTVKIITPPTFKKTVAVIGGGPAGMEAAVTAAGRGHDVTLYEKSDALGGLLKHSVYSAHKWTLKDYMEYQIRQVKKAGITVKLNTTATPDMIKGKGYDTVIAALGAEPVSKSKMKGADGKNVMIGMDVYGREKELGKDVVFIGGGEWGVQTAMYLAEKGHNVMVLSPEQELLTLDRVHYPEYIIDTYDHMENFDYETQVIPQRIDGKKVYYTDASGKEKSVKGDSVVIWSGLRARTEEAVTFAPTAGKGFHAVGDCTTNGGNIQRSVRSAYFAAAQI